jgi:hypothetical protein
MARGVKSSKAGATNLKGLPEQACKTQVFECTSRAA